MTFSPLRRILPLIAACSLLMTVVPVLAQGAAADSMEAAQAFVEKEQFGAAAVMFERIARREPKNGQARFMHAYCLHADGQLEKATAAHRRAAAYPDFRPLAMYNLGCAQALLGQPDRAFDSLEAAVTYGRRDVAQYENDPDLTALRKDERWPALIDRIRDLVKNPEDKALRFWVGEWDVYRRDTKAKAGTNSITLREGGRVIDESWTSVTGGTGESFNYYEPVSRNWKQIWVDQDGNVIEMAGPFADGALRFEGKGFDRNGTTMMHRTTLTPSDNGHVRQFIEYSRDGGLTWTTAYDLVYVPRGEPYGAASSAAPRR